MLAVGRSSCVAAVWELGKGEGIRRCEGGASKARQRSKEKKRNELSVRHSADKGERNKR
jgi:hypothetical protein